MDKQLPRSYKQNMAGVNDIRDEMTSEDFMRVWKKMLKEYEQELLFRGYKKVEGRIVDGSMGEYSI